MIVQCNFCFAYMDESNFVRHLKGEHAEEVIDDAMTYTTLIGYSTQVNE